MLRTQVKTVNITATSEVEVQNGVGTPVFVMSGSINTNGEITTGTSVKNYPLYAKYMDEVMADNAAFMKMIKEEKDRIDAEQESGD